MKRCSKCGEEKAVEDFSRNRRERDGRRSWCKDCCNADSQRRYEADPASYAAKNKRWHAANSGQRHKTRKRWEEKNPGKALAGRERYKQRHPAKARAGQVVRNAVHRGTLAKPSTCEGCGRKVDNPRDLHAHHDDYDKPLEIEWLCRRCHNERHNDD